MPVTRYLKESRFVVYPKVFGDGDVVRIVGGGADSGKEYFEGTGNEWERVIYYTEGYICDRG